MYLAQQDKNYNFLVICDHASNYIPREYSYLGLETEVIDSHISFDLGAEEIASNLSKKLNCFVVSSEYSRLLIDLNRGVDDPTLIMKISDRKKITGNLSVKFNLTDIERKKRIRDFYNPYHSSISEILTKAERKNILTSIVSIHSFTPEWKGKKRDIEMGILWDKDDRLAKIFLKNYKNINVGNNKPYSGRLKNDTLYKHGTRKGFPHVLIEIRQDLINTQNKQKIWADKIYKTLIYNVDKIGLFKKKKYGSFVD